MYQLLISMLLAYCVFPGAVVAQLPGEILDLSTWKLTLPVDSPNVSGSPDEIRQPELMKYQNDRFFFVRRSDESGSAVVFRALCDGATTRGSKYPRTELREMNVDGSAASWGTDDGRTHQLTVDLVVLQTPAKKKDVICVQIHNEKDKIFAVRVEGKKLIAEGEGQKDYIINDDYKLGTRFNVSLVARSGKILFLYNGEPTFTWDSQSSGCYFKAGCYTQSNPTNDEPTDSGGEVAIFYLKTLHSPQK